MNHTNLQKSVPFDFDSDFVKLHFGHDKKKQITYAEFTQILHVNKQNIKLNISI